MIFSDFSEEQQRTLISKIIQYEGKLNSVFDKEPLIFSEITKVFNIPENRDTSDPLYKLKERLVNICLQEKEQFLEYLCLPKFRQVSQHALQLLKTALQEISERIKIQQQNAKFDALVNGIQRYIPKVNSLAEIQNYHLKIFELYSKSNICPVGANERQIQQINAQKNQMKEMKSSWNFQNSPYSNFVKSAPQGQNKYEFWGNHVNDNKMGPEESEIMYSSAFYRGVKEPLSSQILMYPVLSNTSCIAPIQSSTSLKYRANRQSKLPSSHMIDEYSQASSIKRQKQEQNSRMVEEYSQPLSNVSQPKHKRFDVVDPNFKKCVCKGRIQKVGQEEFICEFCNGKFHSECLKMNDKCQDTIKKCPICAAQEIQNECFELIKPVLISSWITYNKQNSTASAIKFTQPLLNQMKKIISQSQNKVYLKLVTIKKRRKISFEESQNIVANIEEDLGIKSKLEIESNEAINDHEEEIQYEMEKEESEKVEEAHQVNQSQNIIKKSQSPLKQITSVTQTKSSIELTLRYISEMLKTSSPVLSLNFGYSPEYQDANSKEIIHEEWLIYYGIYEVKRKQLPEILYKVTCQSSVTIVEGEIPFDERRISSIISNQLPQQDKSLIIEENHIQDLIKTFQLKFLISKRQLRQVSQSAQQQSKQIYPVRFAQCNNVQHVFELENYLESMYSFNMNSKTMEHYNIKRLSPDIDLNQCPLCVRTSATYEKMINAGQDVIHENKHYYLDRKLHALLNDPQTLEQIILRYDDSSSGQQFNYVDIVVDLKFSINPDTRLIQYDYFLTQAESPKYDEYEEQTPFGGMNQKNKEKQESDSMEIEDYMKDDEQNAGENPNQQDQQESVIDYGADQQQQNQTDKVEQKKEANKHSLEA